MVGRAAPLRGLEDIERSQIRLERARKAGRDLPGGLTRASAPFFHLVFTLVGI